MGKEYEAKFLDIDKKKMIKILKKIGAKKVHKDIKLVRAVYELCNAKVTGYARVRDEGYGVTMTTKIYENPNYPDEYEVKIAEDFETGKAFLESLNLTKKAYQESYREKWKHPKAHEITFDTLPGLPTYMEIDCDSEDNLKYMIKKLGVDESKKRYGAFDRTYNEYYDIPNEVINRKTPFLTFKNIEKEIKPKKNKDMLKKIAKEQKNM
jgi:adenylate cyclase, class 2